MEARDTELRALAAALLAEQHTLHLATADGNGAPEASVAPFVMHGGALHVYLSSLAPHTGNLRQRNEACALLVRDEADSPEPFARPRITLRCRVQEVPRGGAAWHAVLDAFEARFGDTAATVRGLADFALFRLQPVEARVVAGFARAGGLDGAALAALLGARRGC